MTVPERVRAALDRLTPGWATVRGVVAVSGGVDSVALLRSLVEIGATITVAHLNHQLRGDEGDGDEAFVIELANQLGVPERTERIDVAGQGGNLEATARRVRYDWLAKIATEVNAGWIATGHTADDQAETVLHRLIRGTGLRGLRGIAEARTAHGPPVATGGFVVLRPLLHVARSELEKYLHGLAQPYRTDSSNTDPRFTRTRIRAELLPLLRTFNPAIVDVLTRLSVQAEEATRFLDAEALKLLEACQLPPAGDTLVLAAEPLQAAHPVLAKAMFRLLWDLAALPANGMTADHWNRLLAVAVGQHPAADFPDGVHVRRVNRVVQIRGSG
jgi:tRNA(Ile)-lysidine synthase